ncbi:MAG: DUF5706 domain-containing protein [Candidatus Magnetoovum sp. WYHC-5]|nr:DUF5706 domain-containing protein [Candidatus Magnetoovum sp. WYHC-5]
MEDDTDKLTFAYETHKQIIGWINNCDVKNGILSALFGGLCATTKFNPQAVSTFYNESGVFMSFLLTALFIALVVSMIFYVYNALKVVYPNIKFSKNNKESLIFYRSISSWELEELRNRYRGLNKLRILEELLAQIHANSQICTKKFENFVKAVKGIIWFFFFYVFLKFFPIW